MLVMATIGVHAQFSISNSTQRRVIVAYDPGSDGYYKRVTNKSVERVDNIVGSYAYDKKAQNLYVMTPNSNIVPQFGITECLIQYKCSVNTPPPHSIRSG